MIGFGDGKFASKRFFINPIKKGKSFSCTLFSYIVRINFPSPEPIIDKNGNYISEICEKKAAVVSFLDGYAKKILNPNDCCEVGINTAKLHLITQDLTGKRENKLSINSWRKIYNKVKKDCSKIHPNLPKVIEKNLDEIEKNWP